MDEIEHLRQANNRLQYELDHANSHIEALTLPSKDFSHDGDFIGGLVIFILMMFSFFIGYAVGIRQ
jgi:hypothetical protein